MIDDEKIMICQDGKEKICRNCAIPYERKNFCVDCFKKSNPLTKQQYKAQVCVANGISGKGMICELTKIPKKEVKNVLEDIRDLGYVEKRWFSYKITDKGMDVNSAYSCVWDKDEDIFLLKKGIREILGIQL